MALSTGPAVIFLAILSLVSAQAGTLNIEIAQPLLSDPTKPPGSGNFLPYTGAYVAVTAGTSGVAAGSSTQITLQSLPPGTVQISLVSAASTPDSAHDTATGTLDLSGKVVFRISSTLAVALNNPQITLRASVVSGGTEQFATTSAPLSISVGPTYNLRPATCLRTQNAGTCTFSNAAGPGECWQQCAQSNQNTADSCYAFSWSSDLNFNAGASNCLQCPEANVDASPFYTTGSSDAIDTSVCTQADLAEYFSALFVSAPSGVSTTSIGGPIVDPTSAVVQQSSGFEDPTVVYNTPTESMITSTTVAVGSTVFLNMTVTKGSEEVADVPVWLQPFAASRIVSLLTVTGQQVTRTGPAYTDRNGIASFAITYLGAGAGSLTLNPYVLGARAETFTINFVATAMPTPMPTNLPTAMPTATPTGMPTRLPTPIPSPVPPTPMPTALPTLAPATPRPTAAPGTTSVGLVLVTDLQRGADCEAYVTPAVNVLRPLISSAQGTFTADCTQAPNSAANGNPVAGGGSTVLVTLVYPAGSTVNAGLDVNLRSQAAAGFFVHCVVVSTTGAIDYSTCDNVYEVITPAGGPTSGGASPFALSPIDGYLFYAAGGSVGVYSQIAGQQSFPTLFDVTAIQAVRDGRGYTLFHVDFDGLIFVSRFEAQANGRLSLREYPVTVDGDTFAVDSFPLYDTTTGSPLNKISSAPNSFGITDDGSIAYIVTGVAGRLRIVPTVATIVEGEPIYGAPFDIPNLVATSIFSGPRYTYVTGSFGGTTTNSVYRILGTNVEQVSTNLPEAGALIVAVDENENPIYVSASRDVMLWKNGQAQLIIPATQTFFFDGLAPVGTSNVPNRATQSVGGFSWGIEINRNGSNTFWFADSSSGYVVRRAQPRFDAPPIFTIAVTSVPGQPETKKRNLVNCGLTPAQISQVQANFQTRLNEVFVGAQVVEIRAVCPTIGLTSVLPVEANFNPVINLIARVTIGNNSPVDVAAQVNVLQNRLELTQILPGARTRPTQLIAAQPTPFLGDITQATPTAQPTSQPTAPPTPQTTPKPTPKPTPKKRTPKPTPKTTTPKPTPKPTPKTTPTPIPTCRSSLNCTGCAARPNCAWFYRGFVQPRIGCVGRGVCQAPFPFCIRFAAQCPKGLANSKKWEKKNPSKQVNKNGSIAKRATRTAVGEEESISFAAGVQN